MVPKTGIRYWCVLPNGLLVRTLPMVQWRKFSVSLGNIILKYMPSWLNMACPVSFLRKWRLMHSNWIPLSRKKRLLAAEICAECLPLPLTHVMPKTLMMRCLFECLRMVTLRLGYIQPMSLTMCNLALSWTMRLTSGLPRYIQWIGWCLCFQRCCPTLLVRCVLKRKNILSRLSLNFLLKQKCAMYGSAVR